MENSELITKALWYIRAQTGNCELTIEEIAEHAGFSTDYFNRIFFAHTGFNVMEYLRFCRLKNAARQLRCSDENVLDINTFICTIEDDIIDGMANLNNFLNPLCFKNIFGL